MVLSITYCCFVLQLTSQEKFSNGDLVLNVFKFQFMITLEFHLGWEHDIYKWTKMFFIPYHQFHILDFVLCTVARASQELRLRSVTLNVGHQRVLSHVAISAVLFKILLVKFDHC